MLNWLWLVTKVGRVQLLQSSREYLHKGSEEVACLNMQWLSIVLICYRFLWFLFWSDCVFSLGGVAYNSPEFLSRWFHYQFH